MALAHAGERRRPTASHDRTAVGQIMAGGKDVQPIDFRELKAMLPASCQACNAARRRAKR